MICWKIRIFAYWTTPPLCFLGSHHRLWFAEKFVSLLIEQHRAHCVGHNAHSCDLLKNSYLCLLNNTAGGIPTAGRTVVICWKIRIFAYWTTPGSLASPSLGSLWFAEKFVSLLIEQHLSISYRHYICSCDLLKNSYLCLLNNTSTSFYVEVYLVVICWKIRIFAYWTTPNARCATLWYPLWFAEKFVSLLIEQHPSAGG